MEFGASIFFTDYSITPAELAVALEERGFDSLWVAEHSHIPVTRRFSPPGGGELTRPPMPGPERSKNFCRASAEWPKKPAATRPATKKAKE